MNQLLQNKVDSLWIRKNNKSAEYVDFILVLDAIIKTNVLTIHQEIVLAKLINRLKKIKNLTNIDCQQLILLLNENGLNIFKSLNKETNI